MDARQLKSSAYALPRLTPPLMELARPLSPAKHAWTSPDISRGTTFAVTETTPSPPSSMYSIYRRTSNVGRRTYAMNVDVCYASGTTRGHGRMIVVLVGEVQVQTVVGARLLERSTDER